ncbi:hypothetical protein EAG_05561 [Camponotus floridanus]|uniref:Uncharacterized protein n=1 Tax=Camponotus floridanus TaxID=104421 RepID=E1ZZQ8_CAMFO|nr:hypothetical protein EAG_05561 [Camponotus floridanus]
MYHKGVAFSLLDRYLKNRLLSPAPATTVPAKNRSCEPHDDRHGAQPASSSPPRPPLRLRDPGIPPHAGEGGVRTLQRERRGERRQGVGDFQNAAESSARQIPETPAENIPPAGATRKWGKSDVESAVESDILNGVAR